MARYRYTYKSFPNCPEATEYSKERESSGVSLTIFAGWISLAAVLCFVTITFDFFESYNWVDFLFGIFFLILSALLDYYVFYSREKNTECELKIILLQSAENDIPHELIEHYCENLRYENKSKNRKKAQYIFSYFFLVMLVTISVIAIIKSVYFICHRNGGILLLITSSAALIVLGIVAFYLVKRNHCVVTGNNIGGLVDRKNSRSKTEQVSDIQYCWKCGTKVLPDSIFCSKCGNMIK